MHDKWGRDYSIRISKRKSAVQAKAKKKTLKLAGSWNSIDDDMFLDLTVNLHNKRSPR